jgi:hypothetical protein
MLLLICDARGQCRVIVPIQKGIEHVTGADGIEGLGSQNGGPRAGARVGG